MLTHFSTRRAFLQQTASLAGAASGLGRVTALAEAPAAPAKTASFFLVGDTHYCADKLEPKNMLPESSQINRRLVEWLNRLPGEALPQAAGGGILAKPHGVIHAGDLIDNGDKGKSALTTAMVDTETAAFLQDYGLNGGDGLLRWPLREVHGNHDGPQGDTAIVREITARNKRRQGIVNVSANGLHYSWDWAGVHFVALGIVAGDAPGIARKRRYAPHGSLSFLIQDLKERVGDSGRPVVITHHIDVHRYSEAVPDEKALHQEWDYGDAQAYYAALAPYRIAGLLCGHTHVRKICRWAGSKDDKTPAGAPFINTDNAAHHSGPKQAILHLEVGTEETLVREFATGDAWQTGQWTPQTWKLRHRV